MTSRKATTAAALFIICITYFLCPSDSLSEFYRYITEDGDVHYVDDLANVPDEYRPQMKVYREKYDHLPEGERSIMLQKDRERDVQRALEELKLRGQRDKEARLKRQQTDVIIIDNQVLVPVTIGYGIKEMEILFLLDTGASHLVLFDDLAGMLGIKSRQKGVSMVAGGDLIETDLVVLDYLKLGPLDLKEVEATVIKHETKSVEPVHFSGLLGMNILRNSRYTIDFENQKIHWQQPN